MKLTGLAYLKGLLRHLRAGLHLFLRQGYGYCYKAGMENGAALGKTGKRVTLLQIVSTFLLIGATGFGGGMAVVALVERRCVIEKKWLGHDEFMHGLAFGQILGPFSLNSTTFVGYYLRGWVGGILAATSFIAPSFALVTAFCYLYFKFHEVPELKSALLGCNPVVIALIVVAGIGMARRKATRFDTAGIAVAAFAASALFDVSGLTVLVLAGCWGLWKGWLAGRMR